MDQIRIKHALLSCWDKTGLKELAFALHERGVKLIASGATAEMLRQEKLPVTSVDQWTGAPEMLEGRVKTLHPRVHAAILYRRDKPDDQASLDAMKLPGIDLVVVNLYPFGHKQALEMIDIGGPTMIRGAAKNYPWVTVLSSPDQYAGFLKEFQAFDGGTTETFRKRCAANVFELMAHYDRQVAQFLHDPQEGAFHGDNFQLDLPLALKLRYGENSQQEAALHYPQGKFPFRQLQGKELSYNNLCDLQAAVQMVLPSAKYFTDQTGVTGHCHCVVIKHQNPCGFATGQTALQAWEGAFNGDSEAAFGGVIACNFEPTVDVAKKWASMFLEVIVAPKFSEEVRAVLAPKTSLRLLEMTESLPTRVQLRSWFDGLLVQTDDSFEAVSEWRTVTATMPTSAQQRSARLAWFVSRYVKSNAVVAALPDRVVAVGAGQMSRVDSVRILMRKIEARKGEFSMDDLAVASDAFFPFKDSVELLAEAGIRCIVQPGGSLRDAEVFQEAERRKISMIATGRRHFYH